MNAVDVITADHEKLRELFSSFNELGPRAYKTKKRTADRLVRELVVHSEVEEQVLYPRVREAVPDLADELDEDLEEHHVTEVLLAELDGMEADDDRFDAKMQVLEELVTHHLEEEEQDLLPRVREAMSAQSLDDLGRQLQQAKEAAPTHPHPWSPDTPPGNVITGVAAGLVDRARDRLARS